MAGQTSPQKTDKKRTSAAFQKQAGKGRPKGSPNKTTALLKDAILKAAEQAGGKEGMVGYLKTQAEENPQSFLPLLGKVLPMQLTGDGDGPLRIEVVRFSDEHG